MRRDGSSAAMAQGYGATIWMRVAITLIDAHHPGQQFVDPIGRVTGQALEHVASEMPLRRQSFGTLAPASASRSTPMIFSSVNRRKLPRQVDTR
jgi:hypothetical protein